MKHHTMIMMFALSLSACADVVTEEPGEPFCLEECLTDEPPSSQPPSSELPTTEPPSTQPPSTEPPPPVEPEEPPPPVEQATLVGTFVSGHLGYYDGCPERAWTEDTDAGGASGDGVACMDPDNCALPCDPATLVIRLTNEGDIRIDGIHVSLIELYGTDDVLRAELPHEATLVLDTAEPFDGTLEPDAEVLLRIEFAGPLNSWRLLQPADADGISDTYPGIIWTTFASDNQADVVVESTEIYPISNIDT